MRRLLHMFSHFVVVMTLLFTLTTIANAADTQKTSAPKVKTSLKTPKHATNAVLQRTELEKSAEANPFSILPYEQIYLLPFNYSSARSALVTDNTPDNQKLQKTEVKFQFSLKSPLWTNFLHKDNTLYMAYTQRSFWQAYNDSPFFRANLFQPELFLENNVNMPLLLGWKFQLLTPGVVHQSNGRGGELERSWNRVYVNTAFARGNWLVSIKPWYVIRDSSVRLHNPDIAHYLGHGSIQAAYKIANNIFTLTSANTIDSRFKRNSSELSWSFPLVKKVRGYAQFSSGYGETLLEYNHRTSSVGVGIAFSDWL